MVIVAVSSYLLAKYSASKPNKLKIKQVQLELVYLPLYRLFEKIPKNPDISVIESAQNEIEGILNSNYVLILPQLHKLNESLKQRLVDGQKYNETFNIMRHQVDVEYEILKKTLGYPSETFRNIYIHMTYKQKCSYFVSWINATWFLTPLLLAPLFFRFFDGRYFIIFVIIVYLVLVPIINKLNSSIKNMND